jgi:hypothetical protein
MRNDPRRNSSSATWSLRPEDLPEDYENPAFIAREIMQTIRQSLSLRRHPEGGHQTCFQDPFKNTRQPLPELTYETL